jgi:hypothetical protein
VRTIKYRSPVILTQRQSLHKHNTLRPNRQDSAPKPCNDCSPLSDMPLGKFDLAKQVIIGEAAIEGPVSLS